MPDQWTPQRIKAVRKRYRERQPDFALRFRVSVDTLRNWEQGKVPPNGPATIILEQLEAGAPADARDLQTA